MIRLLVVPLAVLAVAVPAMGADPSPNTPQPAGSAPAPAPTPPPAVPSKPITVTANKDQKTPWSGEKIVCTREAPVGSLIAVRHCTTKSESDQNERNARELLGRPIAGMGGPQ